MLTLAPEMMFLAFNTKNIYLFILYMIDDLKKSINEIIYERTTSPFYGTLITSWLIWNWKIFYLSFFISENRINGNKIDYIINNCSEIEHILTYPIISSIIILTLVPFVSNGAFWLSLKFNKWRIDQKNIVDMKQLLSIEQSIELREEISKQEERFAKLVASKNLEITQLQSQLEKYHDSINIAPNIIETAYNESELLKLSERIKANTKESQQFEKILSLVQQGYRLAGREDIDSKFISLLESYDLIENKGNGGYKITSVGKKFQKVMLQ